MPWPLRSSESAPTRTSPRRRSASSNATRSCSTVWPSDAPAFVVVCITLSAVAELFDLDLLDDQDPFEIDAQAAHLFKHPALGIDDIYDVWQADPLFYPATPPAHWLMVSEVGGRVLVV